MNSYSALFWPVLFVTVLFVIVPFIARERRKTGITDKKIPFPRLFIVAVIISLAFSAIVLAILRFGRTTPDRSLATMWDTFVVFLPVYGLILALSMGAAVFIYVMRGFALLHRRTDKRLRESVLFPLVCMISATGLLLLSCREDIAGILVFLLGGCFAGLLIGPLAVRKWKRNLRGDRIIYSGSPMQARNFAELPRYWKGMLAGLAGGVIGYGIVFYLIRIELMPRSHVAGAFFGLVIGVCLYGFTWVYLYEKRTGIRLKIEYGDADHAADSPAA